MKRLRNNSLWALGLSLLLSASLVRPLAASTDSTGEEVLDAYLEALGGRDTVAAVESLYREGVLVFESPIAGLSQGRFEITQVPGKSIHRASKLEAFSTTTAWNGEIGWEVGPLGLRSLEGEELLRLQAEAEPFAFAGMKGGEGISVERMPDAPLDGVLHRVVEVREAGREPVTLYFDPEAGWLVHVVQAMVVPGVGKALMVSDFWDYGEHDGLWMPGAVSFAIEGVFSSEVTFDRTVVNGPVDTSRFEMPRQSQ